MPRVYENFFDSQHFKKWARYILIFSVFDNNHTWYYWTEWYLLYKHEEKWNLQEKDLWFNYYREKYLNYYYEGIINLSLSFGIVLYHPLPLLFSLCSFMTAINFFIPELYSFDLRKGVWCKNNTQPNFQNDGGICLFQSIFLSYWVIALCCFGSSKLSNCIWK